MLEPMSLMHPRLLLFQTSFCSSDLEHGDDDEREYDYRVGLVIHHKTRSKPSGRVELGLYDTGLFCYGLGLRLSP